MLQTKRVYDKPSASDGHRVLVDRLWPRGLTKDAARLDEWLKDIAPSPELRKWFGHDPERWEEFKKRYESELSKTAAKPHLDRLCQLAQQGMVTLLYAAREERQNSASILRDVVIVRMLIQAISATKVSR